MNRKNVLTLMFILLFLVVEPVGQARSNEEELMSLSTLKPDRVLKKRFIGLIPDFPWGVWLECGSAAFLVVHPRNLVDHVYIKTSDQALEYIRFFSSFPNFDYFDLHKMVEVIPKRDNGELGFAELPESIFLKHFQVASVKEIVLSAYDDRKEGCCRGRGYYITRTVLMSDSTIYAVEEYVCDDGFYWLQSKKEIMKVKDAWFLPLSTLIK